MPQAMREEERMRILVDKGYVFRNRKGIDFQNYAGRSNLAGLIGNAFIWY